MILQKSEIEREKFKVTTLSSGSRPVGKISWRKILKISL
ncbi:hypothetical protein LEP1GSC108_1378 [Leptospira weilii str. UI 13098]|uniref:Uncharacterized protein n=1 Tax=Leptospira weilii str. UI 13098 TaxID=1088542 RepID=M6Q824_9LEPT|nr:hypothetical protein LEP1GSC108_1378 [Leptospira weilii str. UI 13098]